MKNATKRILLPVAIGLLVVTWPCAVLASYLAFSGASYWSGLPGGEIRAPSGELFLADTELQKLWGLIIQDEDTIVYDFASQSFVIFEAMTPFEVLSGEPEFGAWNVAADTALYADSALAWECTPSQAEIEASGALIHLGDDDRVLCDTPVGAISGGGPTDSDGDGIADGSDNCRNVPNPSQSDTDGDGMGNACDSDDDNDGVSDSSDNCRLTPNSSQVNTDGDAFGDACDSDDDNDLLTDLDEINIYATNPLLFDTDGDGFSDGEEVAAGTNPLDENSFPVPQVPGIGLIGAWLLALALVALSAGWLRRSPSFPPRPDD